MFGQEKRAKLREHLNNQIDPEDRRRFKELFDRELVSFTTSLFMFVGVFDFDITKFDRFLQDKYGYNTKKHGSMKDFLTEGFFPETAEFISEIIKKYPKMEDCK